MRPALLCVCLALLWPPPRAQAQPLADRLPESTLVYTGWSPVAGLEQTKAARMLADPRIIRPWRAVLQNASLSLPGDLAAGGAKVSDHFPKLLIEAAQCEGCFALLDLAAEKNRLAPKAVLVLKLGEHRKAFEEHFKPIQAVLADRLGQRIRMMKLADSWLWVKTARERSEYAWGFLGDSFVFYVGDGADTFLPTLAAPAAKPLKSHPAFAESLAKLPGGDGDPVLTTYVNGQRFLGLVRTLIKQSDNDDLHQLDAAWPKLVAQLGLDNAIALVERTVVANGRFVTQSLLRTDGAPHGLIAALVRGPVDDAALKVVPPDAMFAAAFRLDLAKSYEQLKAGIIAITGEDGRKAFGDVEDAAAGFGVPVASVLGPLGDQWVCYEAASTGAFFLTGVTVVVDVKDEPKLSRTLIALKALLAGQAGGNGAPVVQAYDADGVTIQYLQPGGSFNFVLPAWAVADKRLYVALFPQVVEDAIRQSKSDRSLLDNADFIAARKQVGAGGPVLYLSNPEFIKSLYPIVLPLVSAFREFGVLDDQGDASTLTADLLPSLQRLLAYVGSDAVCVRLTGDGVLRTKSSANPLLTPLTLMDSVPLWVVAALPSLATSAETADRARSAENLRTIGRAVQLYVVDHNGALPPDLVTLTKGNDGVDDNVLRSPFGPDVAKQPPDDYRYLMAGLKSPVPADVVTVYDHAAYEKDEGANVLYGDGHVEWLDRDAVTAALEKTAKWRQEQRR